MDVSSWKTGWHKVTGLELDPKNPRLPGVGGNTSTRDIVAALIEHEDVLALTKSIVDFGGLYPSERLVVVDDNGEKIVVEGNRRLSALKLLQSPDLAPERLVDKFRNLSAKIAQQAIQKVEIVIAPSRSAAARLIVARHAGDSLRRWSTAQQARFIRTLVDDGKLTIEEAAAEIQMSGGDIKNFLRTDTMIRLAYVMPLEKAVRDKLDDFPVATLQRVVQSTEGQAFLGITFDADGNAVGNTNEDEFKKGYTKIVSDIANREINTRDINSSEDIKKYLKGLGAAKPDTSKKGTWTSTAILSGNTAQAKKAIKAATKAKAAKPKGDAFLIPRTFSCKLKSPRILEILSELRRLKIGDYPNSCAVMLRIFMELVISNHLEKTGKMQPMLDKAKKEKKGDDWAPTLRQMMAEVLKDADVKLKPLPKKALNKMVSNHDSWLSLDHIDQFVHNQYVAPTERELRMIWSAIEPLIVLFMDEPAAAGS